MAKAWRYWTKDFWRDFIALKDPLVKFNGSMIKEIVRRLVNNSPDVSIDRDYVKKTIDKSPCEIFVRGHLHRAINSHHGSKRALQMGCFRDEYFIIDGGRSFRPILKPCLEVYLKKNQISGIVSRELKGPDRPPESFPSSIFDVVPEVRRLLKELEDRSHDKPRRGTRENRLNEEDHQLLDSLSYP